MACHLVTPNHHLNQYWYTVNWKCYNKLKCNLNQNAIVELLNMHLKMLSSKYQSFSSGHNMLTFSVPKHLARSCLHFYSLAHNYLIHLSHCYHIFPWLFVWDVCYIIFCYLLHIHSGKAGNLFSLLLCSLWWVQIVRYVLTWRSYSFICTLHHLITIVQAYLKTLNS